MRDSTRSKAVVQSQAMISPSITVHQYVVGTIGPSPLRTRVVVIAGAVALYGTLSLLVHAVIVPGVLLVGVIYKYFNRPVGIAATSHGFVIFHNSWWTGRPESVALTLSPDAFATTAVVRSRHFVHFPPERLWISTREFDRLRGRRQKSKR